MKHCVLVQELQRGLSRRYQPEQVSQWTRYRRVHTTPRQRRSDIWSPPVRTLPPGKDGKNVNTTTLLAAAGFIRQNYAGIYQFLPLGLRVLEKLERLIDKHMQSLGASKVSLSSISSQALWKRSGRFRDGEIFKFQGRGEGEWLLAPTHEEEFTTMMQFYVVSPKQLPVRLYQIGRKYRDEQRPRGGLLRGKEFIMKDLYTFDKTVDEAQETYGKVRAAYHNFLDELGVPYVEVRADSGKMGGNLSHEYHFPHPEGEDTVISCDSCDYSRNEEFVMPVKTETHKIRPIVRKTADTTEDAAGISCHAFITKDSRSLIEVVTRQLSTDKARSAITRSRINTHVLKSVLGARVDIDTGIEEPAALSRFAEQLRASTRAYESQEPSEVGIYYIVDKHVSKKDALRKTTQEPSGVSETDQTVPGLLILSGSTSDSRSDSRIDLIRPRSGDPCPFCESGKLKVQTAIEIGHTFHLGTRYTSRFDFKVPSENVRETRTSTAPFVEMGCHGIGVTRLIAAAAGCLSTNERLRWPQAIAPYDVVICVDAKNEDALKAAEKFYDELTDKSGGQIDVLLDDRPQQLKQKMFEARAIGCPVSAVFGRLLKDGKVEVFRDGEAEDVWLEDAARRIREVLGVNSSGLYVLL